MKKLIIENADCSIHNECERVVPAWLVLLDNIPTLIMFILGAMIVGSIWRPLAILMLLYNISTIVLFWGLICRHCHHFGTRACPCGYGMIAAKYFRKRDGENFRKIFKRNIAIMYPCWFIPSGVGIYLLCKGAPKGFVLLFIAFAAVGYILIPAISKFVGCKGCELRKDCPWMSAEAANK
jgi:hypothetical protein